MIRVMGFAVLAIGCAPAAPAPPVDAGCRYDACVADCMGRCPITCTPGAADCRGDCQRACPVECQALTGCE